MDNRKYIWVYQLDENKRTVICYRHTDRYNADQRLAKILQDIHYSPFLGCGSTGPLGKMTASEMIEKHPHWKGYAITISKQ